MNSESLTDRVRSQVRVSLVRQGASADAPITESFLIRDGHFCGRRFEIDGLTAVWFVEERQLKFYNRQGNLHRSVPCEEQQSPRDAA